ncbi:MAG: DNA-directed DNA polymerase III PolC [Bacteroidetes bacterium]|nr:MAG: DNA-directed DNA polymerase III PolC [Bacteroidota bacterium]
MPTFSHLHVHTQFSLLDGAAGISDLYRKAVGDNMPAIAITDHGNMFGAFKFVAEAAKHNTAENPNRIKPIVGCEFYLVDDRHQKQFSRDVRDNRYHQLMLAKNAEGYKNLVKLCSLGYIEGFYSKYPRIDKELILKYHSGLIATTCCLAASVPRTILRKGEEEGEKEFKWWLDLFGEDYYIELQRHDIPDQNKVNEVLLRFAVKYGVKIIASNDTHYVDVTDYNAHDILLCINTGEKQSTPTMKEFNDDDNSGKGKRFAFWNDQFYLKTQAEMTELFSDVPEALDNTNEIVDKVELLQLKRDILLPHFQIPENFQTQDQYLRHITYEGARKRWGEIILPDVDERLQFELGTIEKMGFAGYFLIVADFINHGRDIGVFVGPGRGSAAGSAVAFCIGITNIDPIKYDLLFERFLNPDRKSMPDIDTDFDDEGRQKVIDYVVDKYGRNQVAQIVTYGTMAAKMSIKDVARVLDLPLDQANALAKLVPDKPGIELDRVINAPMDGEKSLREKEGLNGDDLENVKQLRIIHKGSDERAAVLREALVLEGSVRGTGIHAAGIIIAPRDLTEIIPVCTSKESTLLITQYDGKVIEDAGAIKMDFLGLKTLTIIRDALRMIKENHGRDINIDEIPLDDKKTFDLYQRGETNGTFQFESAGMQKYLRELKPDKFEDLIAMNALYRPGPLEYIPNFILRKHGREKISYDLPEMEQYLKDTYGITVYQEQVMLLSQKLAGFTKGDADVLRKAMGKKDKATLDKMKSKFIDGIRKNNLDEKICEKVWTDWEAFAQYAFNKSHSTCYAFVAYQTAYLKAHYAAEYMASVLTHNLGNIDKITFFMEESRRIGIPVLGPDINESQLRFSVNQKGEIRFGLAAVKGVGEGAVLAIEEERRNNGPFTSFFDVVRRINLRAANKKTFESMAYAGVFDSFTNMHRAQFLHTDGANGSTFLEKAMRYGLGFQESKNSSQVSLFDMSGSEDVEMPEPPVPKIEPWIPLEKLKFERDVIGIYHPLDDFRIEMENFCRDKVGMLKDLAPIRGRDMSVGGMITTVNHKMTKTGKPFGTFVLEDYNDSFEFALFGEDYVKFKSFILTPGFFVSIRGKVQERFGNADNLEMKVHSMELLTELLEKKVKSITLSMPLHAVNDELIEMINNLVQVHPGPCQVKFALVEKMENIGITLASRKLRVKPDNTFLKELRNRLPEVEYKLN